MFYDNDRDQFRLEPLGPNHLCYTKGDVTHYMACDMTNLFPVLMRNSVQFCSIFNHFRGNNFDMAIISESSRAQ